MSTTTQRPAAGPFLVTSAHEPHAGRRVAAGKTLATPPFRRSKDGRLIAWFFLVMALLFILAAACGAVT